MLHPSENLPLDKILSERAHRLQRRLDRWRSWSKKTSGIWHQWTNRRLAVGLLLAAGLVMTALPGSAPYWAAGTFFILLPAFIFCVRITSKVRGKLRLAQGLIAYYERALGRLNGEYQDQRAHTEAEDPDLQRTGAKSLLSFMDESFTTEGRGHLKELLYQRTDLEAALKRQKRIQALSPYSWPVARWMVTGQIEAEKINLKRIDALFESFQLSREDKLHSWASILSFSLFLTLLLTLGPSSSTVWYVFFAQGMVHLAYLPRSGRLLHRALELSHHWHQIDRQTRQLFQKDFWRKSFPGGFIFEKFSARQSGRLKTLISFADINNHPILSVFVHLALPWLPVVCLLLGRFMERWKTSWPTWRGEFVDIEKASSLALFSYWQTVSYPEFTSEVSFSARDLYHPLISRSQRVANDVAFQPPLKTVLLSGSNMAGKSTFLRTLALNQILAAAGLPVFASKLTTFHGPVLSCIQISDSLRDGFSYFMSEVMRLREVLTEASLPGRPCLVVIDEIFRGTNNKERRLGSQSVIRKLMDTPSLSVVSTHDLELTKLAEGNPRAQNYHFREDYREEEMVFFYKLHQGPSPTTNALRIMADHGLYEEKPLST